MDKEETYFLIPETIKTIGKESFRGNRHIKTIFVPSTITTFEDYAFSTFEKLNMVIIEGKETIKTGEEPFYQNSQLEEVRIRQDIDENKAIINTKKPLNRTGKK